MADRMERSREAVEASLVAQAGFARYQMAQRNAKRARADWDPAHPLQFDESGFPIKQRRPTFAVRVAHLLRPF